MSTTTITVEAVNVKEKKTFTYKKGNKQGQQGFLYPIGLNVGGKWINGTAFSEEEADIYRNLKKGDKLNVVMYEEEYQGKMYEKFKLPNDKDQLKAGYEELKSEIETLKQTIAILVKENKLKYVAPKVEPKQHAPLTKEQVSSFSDINPPDSDLPF